MPACYSVKVSHLPTPIPAVTARPRPVRGDLAGVRRAYGDPWGLLVGSHSPLPFGWGYLGCTASATGSIWSMFNRMSPHSSLSRDEARSTMARFAHGRRPGTVAGLFVARTPILAGGGPRRQSGYQLRGLSRRRRLSPRPPRSILDTRRRPGTGQEIRNWHRNGSAMVPAWYQVGTNGVPVWGCACCSAYYR